MPNNPAEVDLSLIMKAMLARCRAGIRSVAIATVEPGNQVVFDDCCEGKLWVRVVSLVGSPAMSNPGMQKCAMIFQCRIGIGVVRCAHVVDDQGQPPAPDDMSADAFSTFKDMQDLLIAMTDIREMGGVETFKVEQWLPSGPEGGCVGGEWTATFNYIPNICEEN